MNKIFLILFLIFTNTLFAQQTGTISGVISDKEYDNEPLSFATIIIKGTQTGTTSDMDGRFSLRDVREGTYTISISFVGYETVDVPNVIVEPNKTTEVNVTLGSSSVSLDDIIVRTARRTNTESAVVLEIQQAKQVVSGISSEQMARSVDNNAAQAVQRIPGVTIIENRFVMIRGLSERYNNVMINNTVAPSTEVDKRTFSFDLIPTSALDRMMIYKTGSADLPGDFAGGVIKLYTVENVPQNYTNVSFGFGYRAGASFNPYLQSEGSGTDFLGFDNGFRKLPGNFPSTSIIANSPRNSIIRQDAGRSLANNFEPTESTALPDFSIGFNMGRNFDFANGNRLTMINSISYSNSHQYNERTFKRYLTWVDQTQPILERFSFVDQNYENNVRLTAMSNWVYRFGKHNRIKFKNLFNQIGENETTIRNGIDFIQRPNDDLRNYMLGYKSRSIYTGQLEGEHRLAPNQLINWAAGYNLLNESEPDLRRFRTFRSKDEPDGPFTMQLPPSSNLFETGRYFGELSEYSVNQGTTYTYEVQRENFDPLKFRTGYYVDYRDRTFDSRYFSYLYPGFNDPNIGQQLSQLPLSEIFSPENIRTQNGFILEEGTRPIDSYTASNLLAAGFVGFEVPYKRFDIAGGVRYEYNLQKLNTRDDIEEINVESPIGSILPFANIGYSLGERSILRLGYSRTVNRPEFRELAPYLFYDFEYEAGRIGNPELETATIDNIDLRYEFYPSVGETISIGAFYKQFDNPIETRNIIVTEQPLFNFINADEATVYGFELEFKKSFRGLTNSAFVDRFSGNINASLIFSEVDLGETAVAQDRVRDLQGQSPYIINAAINYADDKDLIVNAVFNRFGDRIFAVGDDNSPTIYELSRNSLDLSITKKFNERYTVKFGVQDLLNAKYQFFEDSNGNFKIDSDDNPISTFKRGQLFNFTITYSIL